MHFEKRLWAYTKGARLRIVAAVLIGLLSTTAGVARLALLGWLIGKIFSGASFSELTWPMAGVAGVMLLRGLLEYVREMMAHRTAAVVQKTLRRHLYNQIAVLGPGYATHQRSGELVLSLVDGIEQLETYFGKYLPQLMVSALTPIVIFSFVVFIDRPVATALLVAALIALLAPAIWHKFDTAKSQARQKAYAAFASEFLDAVQGLATLKAFGQSGARAKLLARRAHELFRSTMWVLATNSLARGITDCSIAIGAATALGIGAYRVNAGAMELTSLLIILMLGVEIFRPMRDLRTVLHQGMVGMSAAHGLYQILDATPPVVEHTPEVRDEPLTPNIKFDGVRFRYPGQRRNVHDGLSLAVAVGERIGVVGPSGCGKSSIVRLLLRFYDAEHGSIEIGGQDLRSLSLADVRRHISVVNQDTYLFHGSVEDNIRMGKPEANEQEIIAAAQAANIHDFVTTLPQGYQTIVGEKGIKLSGGQRQRVAIARALLRDAPILVLDEALSAVDAENESIILQALDRLMQGRTTLVLAHRLSSIIDCDRILVLNDGHVVENGNHSQLMAANGVYRHLMSEQAQAEDIGMPTKPTQTSTVPSEPDEERSGDIVSQTTEGIVRAEGLNWSQVIRILMGHIMPWKGRLILTFAFGVLRVLAFIGVGVYSALIVLALKNGVPFESHLWALAIVAPLSGILHWCESWTAHDMAFRLLAEMRIATFRKLDQLAPAYLVRRRTGDLMGIVTQDIELVEYFFAHTVAPAFVSILIPGLVMIVLVLQSPWLALALLPFLLAVALSPLLLRHRVDKLGARSREAAGELSAHAIDSVQGLTEIVAFHLEKRRGDEFDDLADQHIRLRLPFFDQLTQQHSLVEILTGLGGLAVVATGAHLTSHNMIDAGLLPLLTILAMAAFLPVSEIAEVGRQLADTLGATRRVYALENEPVPVTDGPSLMKAKPVDAAITLDTVRFAYPGQQRTALEDLSLEIPAGHTVALVGPSGAGKTTVAHLLMRFWDPTLGEIRFAGQTLDNYQLGALRANIALVAQDTYLFNDTLEANIRIARPDAPEDKVHQAIELAALSDLIATLPEGLQTSVGERGASLSGGQRQRVAIARAFLKDAPVLILDEATSHLDAVSEQTVRHALDELQATRTTIVIAHRLSTIQNADLIVALNNGRLVEQGKHAELLAAGGLYAQLVYHQVTRGQHANDTGPPPLASAH